MKLELYYYDQCPFCMRVLRAIQELSLQDKIEFKNTLTVPQNRANHLKRTGRTTVPCLYIDEKPLFESADIIDWLKNNKDNI